MLQKIKEFFMKIFKGNSIKYIEAPKEVNELEYGYDKKEKFDFGYVKADNEKYEKALKLQKEYKAGLIEENDLSDEDFELLTNLYEKQIDYTKKSIENYKNKIISVRSKLATTTKSN